MTDEKTPPESHVGTETDDKMEVDGLAGAFLAQLTQKKVAALVFYSFDRNGKPVARLKSNTPPEATQAAVRWLNQAHETKAAEAAARAMIYEIFGGKADELTKQRYLGIAKKALAAAKDAVMGKVLV